MDKDNCLHILWPAPVKRDQKFEGALPRRGRCKRLLVSADWITCHSASMRSEALKRTDLRMRSAAEMVQWESDLKKSVVSLFL